MTGSHELDLPDELWGAIFSHLSGSDVCGVSLTCRRFLGISREDFVWKRVVVCDETLCMCELAETDNIFQCISEMGLHRFSRHEKRIPSNGVLTHAVRQVHVTPSDERCHFIKVLIEPFIRDRIYYELQVRGPVGNFDCFPNVFSSVTLCLQFIGGGSGMDLAFGVADERTQLVRKIAYCLLLFVGCWCMLFCTIPLRNCFLVEWRLGQGFLGKRNVLRWSLLHPWIARTPIYDV